MKIFSKTKNKVKVEQVKSENGSVMGRVLVGSVVAVCISMLAVLIFAFLLKFFPISDTVIQPINQVIKCLSILLGSFVALKKNKEHGLVTGLLIGILYTILAFLIFSALDGNFEFGRTLVNDMLFGGIIGAITGIISVNIGKKR